jgi:hypothetical protein
VSPKRTLLGTFSLPTNAGRVAITVVRDRHWDGSVRTGGPTTLGTVERPTDAPTVLTHGAVPPDVVAGATLLQSQLNALAARLAKLPDGGSCCAPR